MRGSNNFNDKLNNEEIFLQEFQVILKRLHASELSEILEENQYEQLHNLIHIPGLYFRKWKGKAVASKKDAHR